MITAMPSRARVLAAGAVVLAAVVWIVLAWMGPRATADPSSSWGPLAVLDSDSVPDARIDGRVRIGSECVVLETALGDWSLVFNARIARWEASDRVIVLRASQGGEVAIMDGADVTLGGAAAFGDDAAVDYDAWSRTVSWVAPPADRCERTAVWVAGTAALRGP